MESTTTSTLGDVSSVIVKAIAGGHLPSVAEAIVKQTELADMIFQFSFNPHNWLINFYMLQLEVNKMHTSTVNIDSSYMLI